MHIITIEKGVSGRFNVLLNGHSYRIHRNLPKERALAACRTSRPLSRKIGPFQVEMAR